MLYGPDGRPLPAPPKRELTRRVAQPTLTGWRRAQQWASVVSALDPARLRSILRSVASGAWTPDFLELAEEIEERDLHFRGVLQQRRLAVAGAPIGVVAASDEAADVEIADDVRERVVQGAGFHDMVLDLLDALAKGLACVEVVWSAASGRWQPASYHRVDPRWLVMSDVDGSTPLLVRDRAADVQTSARAAVGGGWSQAPADPLAPGKFIVHTHRGKSGIPLRGGLAFSVASMYVLKSAAVRDWWSYSELFGIPTRIGRYGPTATDDDIRTLEDAISALASDAGCSIPEGMEIDLHMPSGSGSSSGPPMFQMMVDWVDRQVSKAVVGQTMTADDGSSRSQAEVHADVRDDIVRDDARHVCGTLSDQLVAWYCALNYPPRPAGPPRIELPQPPEAIDLPSIVQAATAGLRVPAAWLYERLGIPPPADGDEVLAGRPRPELHAADEAAAERALAGMGRGADAVSADLADAVSEMLDGAADADEFLAAAGAAGIPETLARDMALLRFGARVDGEEG